MSLGIQGSKMVLAMEVLLLYPYENRGICYPINTSFDIE
jgi:hypothetical protein